MPTADAHAAQALAPPRCREEGPVHELQAPRDSLHLAAPEAACFFAVHALLAEIAANVVKQYRFTNLLFALGCPRLPQLRLDEYLRPGCKEG